MKNRLADLRKVHNLTQADLAKEVEVSRQTIISIEQGQYNPSLILAFKLADFFDKKLIQTTLLALSFFLLTYMGYLNKVSAFTILAIIIISGLAGAVYNIYLRKNN